jgi:hypothetical protein
VGLLDLVRPRHRMLLATAPAAVNRPQGLDS